MGEYKTLYGIRIRLFRQKNKIMGQRLCTLCFLQSLVELQQRFYVSWSGVRLSFYNMIHSIYTSSLSNSFSFVVSREIGENNSVFQLAPKNTKVKPIGSLCPFSRISKVTDKLRISFTIASCQKRFSLIPSIRVASSIAILVGNSMTYLCVAFPNNFSTHQSNGLVSLA